MASERRGSKANQFAQCSSRPRAWPYERFARASRAA